MEIKQKTGLILMMSFLILASCEKEVNLFTVSQDIEFGMQMKQEIESNPDQFNLLKQEDAPEAYQHLQRIRDNILNTGELKYKDRFSWEVYIIDNDTVVNAFACPGGYMYFYTGLIRFLDNEAQFAGVMAHEMAHVDLRHSTKSMTKYYGYSILMNVLLGKNPSKMAEIAAELALGLGNLKFSRDHEYQADEYAVTYLYNTSYNAPSLADFFEKMEGSKRPPEFLSTHPSPDNRYENINEVFQSLGGVNGELFETRYQEFIESLP